MTDFDDCLLVMLQYPLKILITATRFYMGCPNIQQSPTYTENTKLPMPYSHTCSTFQSSVLQIERTTCTLVARQIPNYLILNAIKPYRRRKSPMYPKLFLETTVVFQNPIAISISNDLTCYRLL